MPLDGTPPIFIDATCLVAAAGSARGGSSYILSLCEQGFLSGRVSRPVLREAARNIQAKMPPSAFSRYRHFMRSVPLPLAHVSTRTQRPYIAIAGAKDAHVLAAALAASARFLITLDRPLIQRVNDAQLAIRALTPGDFITTILPEYSNYDDLHRSN